MNRFMKLAFKEAKKGVKKKDGGPFGAVIVKGGRVISKAHNKVVSKKDPTAHAEILAIRKAAEKLNDFNLFGCELYSTCEPCPMCFSAIHWARIDKLYYACTRHDAASAGFDDKHIYDVIRGKVKDRNLKIVKVDSKECLVLFDEWKGIPDKTRY